MQNDEILTETGTNELEIIEFFITEKRPDKPEDNFFGVNVAKVLEVIEKPVGLVPPEAPPHPCYLGAISLRGQPLALLDLARWLQMEKHPTEHEVILVTEFNETVTGFLVSGVTQIHRVSWRDVESPSSCLANLPTNCINGLVHLGDRFVQLLDLEKILAELDPDLAGKTGEAGIAAGRNYKALVADDSTVIRNMLKQNLEKAGFIVETAVNGEDALNRLQATKSKATKENRPITDYLTIVVSDIEMPRMDGYSLTKALKNDPVLKPLPVVLFSSLITEAQMHKGKSVGANAQISKPDFDTLGKIAVDLIEGAA